MTPIIMLTAAMSALGCALMVSQFAMKKETEAHMMRGILVLTIPVAVVIINTIAVTAERDLIWDAPFTLHVLTGGGFFLFASLALAYGYKTMEHGTAYRAIHAMHARIACAFLASSLALGAVVYWVRHGT